MSVTSNNTGGLRPGHVIRAGGDLAVFLGGSPDSFTGLLVTLLFKADPRNLAILRSAFPRETRARAWWMTTMPAPTAGELAAVIDALA